MRFAQFTGGTESRLFVGVLRAAFGRLVEVTQALLRQLRHVALSSDEEVVPLVDGALQLLTIMYQIQRRCRSFDKVRHVYHMVLLAQ